MNITGNNRNNTLKGTNGDDVIMGLGGRDVLNGLGGNDFLDGGVGNDILRGGTGDNSYVGGEGNDTYVLTGRYEVIQIGAGEDRVDLSGFSLGDGFLTMYAGPTARGIFAIIDGEEDFGAIRVDNGPEPEGLVFFTDLNNALQLDFTKPEGGMEILGTAFDDIFQIDTGAQGWIQIRPGEGEDVIQIEGNSGTVRLDYVDMTDGIFAHLKFGTIIEGGSGFTMDRVIGTGLVKQLRATDFDDTVYGNRLDNTFIMRAGDDFVSGGAGTDTIRYDRSGVDRVEVDLGRGTATGTWNGEAFTHTLRNIENIRGSRNDNDLLFGNGDDNFINGYGGNDTIQGRGGNDFLIGGDGTDLFLFRDGDGNDVIQDFNTANNREKINLKGVTEITSFADLRANHLTEFNAGSVRQTVIDDGAGLSITLTGVLIADLDRGDFVF